MRCVVLGLRNAVRCEIWCYGDMVIWPALQARAFALVILLYLIVLWFVVCRRRRLSSSFVIPKKSSQLCTLLLARARARQMASGGFAISISGTTNRSEIMDSFNLNVLYNRLSGYLHERSRLLTFGDFSQQAAVATVLSLIQYGI